MSTVDTILVVLGIAVAVAVFLQVSGKVDILGLVRKATKKDEPAATQAGNVGQQAGFSPSIVPQGVAVPPQAPPSAIGAGPNMFPIWMAQGLSIQQVLIDKLHRGLTVTEAIDARAAGYDIDPKPAPSGAVDRGGQDISDFAIHENDVPAGGTLELTFTLNRRQTVQIATCAMRGTYFHHAQSDLNGPVGAVFGDHGVVQYSSVRDTMPDAPPGSYTYRITVDDACRLGTQLVLA